MADYFENCKWSVESVSVCREVEPLRRVLERRTNALLKLENAWADWVGNPAKGVSGYDPDLYVKRNKIARSLTASPQRADVLLVDIHDEDNEESGQRSQSGQSSSSNLMASRDVETGEEDYCHVHTTRPRPTFRPRWFGAKVDAIEFWEKKFKEADEKVRLLRKKGKFEASQSAFVTFEHVKDAVSAFGMRNVGLQAANGMSGGPLPSSLTSHHRARTRAERCGVEQHRHDSASDSDSRTARYRDLHVHLSVLDP